MTKLSAQHFSLPAGGRIPYVDKMECSCAAFEDEKNCFHLVLVQLIFWGASQDPTRAKYGLNEQNREGVKTFSRFL